MTASHRSAVGGFALAVLGLYALVWGAERAFPRTLASAVALVAATAAGAWVTRPGWNLRPERADARSIALLGILLASAAAAALALRSLDVPLPYTVSTEAIARALPVIIVVTGIEELLFRQVMYRWLEKRGVSRRSVIVATALAFAGAHLGPIVTGSTIGRTFYLLQSAYMVWVGLLLGHLRSESGSWLVPWLGHFGYNIAVLYFLTLAS